MNQSKGSIQVIGNRSSTSPPSVQAQYCGSVKYLPLCTACIWGDNDTLLRVEVLSDVTEE